MHQELEERLEQRLHEGLDKGLEDSLETKKTLSFRKHWSNRLPIW
jgi:DNA-binding ferritin-like protein (Dps family)